jgi:hypothetical protein
MKKLLIAILTLALAQTTFAQQAGRFRIGMDLGPAIPQGGGIGALLNLEPKVNLNNRMNVRDTIWSGRCSQRCDLL